MATERAGWGKFTQTVPDHILSNIDRHMATSIMNRDRVSNHLWEDHTRSTPGTDHGFITGSFMVSIFLSNFGLINGPFFRDRDIFLSPNLSYY